MNLPCLYYKMTFKPNMEADWFISVSKYPDTNGMCFHVCICVNPHVPVCNVQLAFPGTQNIILQGKMTTLVRMGFLTTATSHLKIYIIPSLHPSPLLTYIPLPLESKQFKDLENL